MLHWLPAAVRPRFFAAVLQVLRPGGVLHIEGAGVGKHPQHSRRLSRDTGEVFEEVERAGFDVPRGGVHAVAQRRRFSAEQ